MKRNKKSIYETHPKLIDEEWDYKKNNELGLDPKKLTDGSNKKAWWKCKKDGNEWQSQIYGRMGKQKHGCPMCAGNKKLDTKTFTERARKNHKNRYSYSKVKYINYSTHVVITCFIHGDFLQTPDKHLSGRNCPKCSRIIGSQKRKKTNEQFIKEVSKIHNKKYNYSKTEYKGFSEKVIIVCPVHGEFLQSPHDHLNGCGCYKCKTTPPSTTKEFIQKAIKIHGNKYDYSKVLYERSWKRVIIICSKHGEFLQIPNNHLRGYDCLKCSKNNIPTNIEFIEKARRIHKNKYNYSKTKYINHRTRIIITCPIHGDFLQSPNSHLSSSGCPKCAKNQVLSTEEFIQKAIKVHKSRYDYSKVKYINNHTYIIITCPIHGDFLQCPGNHLSGQSCPFCFKKKEHKIKKLLEKYFNKKNIKCQYKIWDRYKDYDHKRYCDFWLEKDGRKIMIEYDGHQHYMPVRFGGMSLEQAERNFIRQQKIDKRDIEFCEENNIILHRIKYDEDLEKSIKKLRLKIKELKSDKLTVII